MMYTLGIETSCDETSASVTSGRKILSNIVTSSVHLHSKYGGVVPEIASRFHLEYINPVVREAVSEAGIRLKDIGLIAVTRSPGLAGSLLVGISMARALSFALSVPLIEVDHLSAHLYANIMHYDGIKFPVMGLVISGGHTSVVWMDDLDTRRLLAETQDDAAGEAFDKVSKILGLGYPGGPVIEARAKLGDAQKIKFPSSSFKAKTLDFSFSGIKTAVMYYVKALPEGGLTDKAVNDICAGFQETVSRMVTKNTIEACRKKRARSLVVGGGVSANTRLRERLTEEADKWGIKTYFPPLSLCVDNAAMIGGLGEALFCRAR